MVKEKNVLLTMSSASYEFGQEPEEPIKVMNAGKLSAVPGGYMIRYQETQPDDEGGMIVSDMTLVLMPGSVTMMRSGDFATTMVFEKGKRCDMLYHTPYGDMKMGLFSTVVSCVLGENNGSAHLTYQVEMSDGIPMMHVMDIRYVVEEA